LGKASTSNTNTSELLIYPDPASLAPEKMDNRGIVGFAPRCFANLNSKLLTGQYIVSQFCSGQQYVRRKESLLLIFAHHGFSIYYCLTKI
jgi:hypothetical protein